ncbi:MAG: ABC transporter substrate-binding protein, partial [bacterium]
MLSLIIKLKIKNFINNIKNHKFTKYLSLVFLIFLIFFSTGMISKNNYIDNNNNSTLKLSNIDNILETGKMTSPWRDINIITRLCFRNVFTLNVITGEVKPDLAESYDISTDGLIYNIKFRQDLVWSDGVPITLDDVVFSFESVVLDEELSRIFPVAFDNIVGVNDFITGKYDNISGLFIDDNILTIGLNEPIANFIDILSQFTILPKHILQDQDIPKLADNDFWLDPVVSGMYILEEYIPNEQISYTYNNNYIGTEPNIKSITIRADYQIQDVDYYTTNDILEIMQLSQDPNMQEINIDSIFYRYLVFNIKKFGEIDPVIGDYRVRSAIAHAIDIKSLISDIYFNTVNTFEYGNIIIGSDVLAEKYHDYDPEKSKQLLQEAEYNFDRPIIIMYYYQDETSINFINALAKNLQEVGLQTEIIKSSELYSSSPEIDVYDIALKGLSALDITEWYGEYDSSHDLHRYVFGGEPIFDDLVKELNATTTIDERYEVFNKIQLLGADVLYKFPLFTMNYKAYVNSSRLYIPQNTVLGNPKYKY